MPKLTNSKYRTARFPHSTLPLALKIKRTIALTMMSFLQVVLLTLRKMKEAKPKRETKKLESQISSTLTPLSAAQKIPKAFLMPSIKKLLLTLGPKLANHTIWIRALFSGIFLLRGHQLIKIITNRRLKYFTTATLVAMAMFFLRVKEKKRV